MPTSRPPAPDEDPPTLADVCSALEDYFGPDAQREPARARLVGWGARALPVLRELAQSDWAEREDGDLELVGAIRSIGTEEAGRLLADIFAGGTRIHPYEALAAIATPPAWIARTRGDPNAARRDPRTRSAALAMLETDGWLIRSQLLRLAAIGGWEEFAPEARELTRHEHLSLREAAAEALEALTGEVVAIERPALRVPRTRLVPDLLGAPREPPGSADPRSRAGEASIGGWFDGRRGILAAREGALELLGPRGEVVAALPVDGLAERWCWLDSKEGEPLLAVHVRSRDEGDRITARSADGTLAWEYRPAFSGVEDLVTLYDASGPAGVAVAVGSEAGLVGLDTGGTVAWQLPNRYVVYDLDTHPSLPGRLLFVGGEAILHGTRPAASDPRLQVFEGFTYFHYGALFPDARGAPAVVLAGGVGDVGEEALFRVDAAGREVWRAILPEGCAALTLVERDGRRPWIAVGLDGGELLIFDEDGTLLHRTDVPSDVHGRFVSSLSAGSIGEDEAALLVQGRSAWLYPVVATALEDR